MNPNKNNLSNNRVETELQKSLKSDKQKFIDVFGLIGRSTYTERTISKANPERMAANALYSLREICEATNELAGSIDSSVIDYCNAAMQSINGDEYQKQMRIFFDNVLKFLMVARYYSTDACEMSYILSEIEEYLDNN